MLFYFRKPMWLLLPLKEWNCANMKRIGEKTQTKDDQEIQQSLTKYKVKANSLMIMQQVLK